MKGKNNQQERRLSPAMLEDKATERLKKRAQDLGLIVNAGNKAAAAKQAGEKKGGQK